MGRAAVRAGASTILNTGAYVTTAGVAGSTARVIDLVQGATRGYARPVTIQNLDSTNSMFVRLNADDASATVMDFKLLANEGIVVDWVNVNSLSLYMGAGVYTTAIVQGWINS